MYNATNAATWLRSPPRIALRRNSTQRFVMYNSTNAASRRSAALRYFSRLNSTQRFVCYNASPRGSASHRAPRLPAAHRASIQLNDLFVNLSSHLDDAQRIAANCDLALLISTQLNDLFVTPRRNVAYSIAALFDATQGFVYYFAPLQSAALRNSTRLSAALLSAIQLNELKLN